MRFLKYSTAAPALIFVLMTLYSCMGGGYLRTDPAASREVSGTYTLLLHGVRYSDDVENVAILDKEGDGYSFEIFAPEYDYTVLKQVPAKEALEKAERHVGSHYAVRKTELSRILDRQGNIVGYELKPLYHPLEFGIPDILYIDYTIKGNKIITKIWVRYDREKRKPFLFRR
ncbi:MAG: hypothetical protein C4526_12890 [Nitrospiraceae bacterium]|nr:MAG: hypothetical protein C4526_12890 [Nitrospiraceae bacterium]